MEDSSDCLDLGTLLMSGRSPFPVIEARVRALEPGQTLVCRAPFRPDPLYAHLEAWGVRHRTENDGTGFRIELTRDAPDEPVPFYIDFRNLPPPEPMVRALEAYEALRPGGCLIAHLPHRPARFLEQLDARGIAWEEQAQPDGSCQIYLLKEAPGRPSCG